MKFLRYIIANLVRRPLRTGLTALTIAASIFIFSALLSLDRGVDRMVAETGGERIIAVFDKYKACPPDSKLPARYRDRIEELDHVVEAMPVRFLLSSCQMVTDLVAVHGIEPDRLRRFRAFELDDAAYDAFAADRGSAIVGRAVANRYGWRIGDSVTLQQLRGVSFIISGIFDAPGSSLEAAILVDREYLEYAIDEIGIATMMLVRVDDESNIDQVSTAIDDLFSRDVAPTRSGPERAFIASLIDDFSGMVEFAQMIAYAALALLLAAVANNVSMGLRDRMREVSILKTIGFRRLHIARLMIAESAALGLAAALIGCLAALAVIVFGDYAISIEGYTIVPHFSAGNALAGIVAGASLGALGAVLPALRAARVPIVEGLRDAG